MRLQFIDMKYDQGNIKKMKSSPLLDRHLTEIRDKEHQKTKKSNVNKSQTLKISIRRMKVQICIQAITKI